MKLNKTLMIAALIAGSVFAADVAVRAQDSTNKPAASTPPGGPGARGRMNFDNIATQLALTDEQKTKVKPIFDEMMQKQRDLRQDTAVTDPTERRAKMKEIRDAATTKLKEIPLTQEQLDKWAKMGQGGQRRPGAGAGAPPPAGDTKPPQ
jgi:Spy/CpxP family protein refolding chaperone